MSEQENINKKVKENGKKIFFVLVILIVSAVILVFLLKMLFVNSKINEGRFRVSDVILTSGAEFIDKSKETGVWAYDVWQNNTLALLINTSGADISRAYITNVQAFNSGVEVSQKGTDISIVSGSASELELATDVSGDGDVLYEIDITNKAVLNNFEIPSDITEIKHDATIFALAGLKTDDMKFSVSFVLNIEEKNGRENTMNVSIDLPCGNIVESGVTVTRQNLENFVFKMK